jgi:hypothetical protein
MPTLRPSSSCLNRCKDQAGWCTSSLLFLAIFFDSDLHLLQQLASSCDVGNEAIEEDQTEQ